MLQITAAQFRELDRDEAEALLARNQVGRLAFTFRQHVDIEPIGYVYADGVINFRTSPGRKLDVLHSQGAVAFEVDEVEGPFDWRSVVVHGSVYPTEPEGSEHDRRAHASAVEALRRAYPGALTEDDPAAFRTVILRLYVHRITGREARSA